MRVVRREPADPMPPVEHHAPGAGSTGRSALRRDLTEWSRHADSGKERRSAASSIKLRLMCGGAGSRGEPDKAGTTYDEGYKSGV